MQKETTEINSSTKKLEIRFIIRKIGSNHINSKIVLL